MLTKKFKVCTTGGGLAFLVMAAVGCAPPGPQALLDGKRLLDKGQAGAAAIRLEEAARSMPTNPVAWSYLAVAHHYSGSLSNAESAYRETLRLNPDLTESRFGLGMLYWQQSQWAEAREQFATVTVRRPEHALAWLRLGECQVRLDDVRGALMSLSRAVTLDARSSEAWNWLGVAQVQSRQWRDAEESFEKALELQMNHAPALLNLAILRQQHLDRPREALDLYRQYLAFWPAAANSDDVRLAAVQLERRLAPAPPPAPPKPALPVPPPGQTAAVSVRTPTTPAKAAPSSSTSVPVAPPPQAERAAAAPEPQKQAVRSSQPVPQPAPPEAAASPVAATEITQHADPPSKRGFFARLNPVNLFKGKPDREADVVSPDGAAARTSAQETPIRRSVSKSILAGLPSGAQYRRYAYRVDAPAARGRQEEAQRLAQEAARLRLTGRLSESAVKCREALALEPASYEAHFNLGLVLLQSGDIAAAVPAFEDAMLLNPDSDAARYNFGLTLKQAGYPVDAALEMQRLLEQDPTDVRAHLMLGNLYDRPFGVKSTARSHYLRVLELAPYHPEADAIRFWLKENPL